MILLIGFFVILYTVLVIVNCYAWQNLKNKTKITGQPQTRISILVAVRNEAANIFNLLQSLAELNYPSALFEVIIIDDYSEDESSEIIRAFSLDAQINVRLLSLKNSIGSGKKAAINYGIKEAFGELIVLTDGDCMVQENWLAIIEQEYRKGHVKFISGPVLLSPAKTVFEKLQAVEFCSLIGVGAGSIQLKIPTMCNGANVAYTKEVFLAVNGFKGNEMVASGDDEFLMHKIEKHFPGQIRFVKNKGATVFTKPIPDVKNFVNQRIRWASKWKFYQNPASTLIAFVVFGANISVFAAAIALIFGSISGQQFIGLVALKTITESLFLFLMLSFFNQKALLIYILPLQLIYIPYVLYCALAGLKGNYNWKFRTIKTA